MIPTSMPQPVSNWTLYRMENIKMSIKLGVHTIYGQKNMRFNFVYIAFRFYWPGLIFEIFSGVDLVVDSWVRRREKVCWDQTRQYPSSDGKHNWIPSITRNIGGGQLSTFQFWLARQTHFFFANCIYEIKNCFKYLSEYYILMLLVS